MTICRTLSCSSIGSQIKGRCLTSSLFKSRRNLLASIMRSSISSTGHHMCLRLLSRARNLSLRLSVPSHERVSKISWGLKRGNCKKGTTSIGLIFGLCASSTSEPGNAEASERPVTVDEEEEEVEDDSSSTRSSHGKRVYSDYFIIGEQWHPLRFLVCSGCGLALIVLQSCGSMLLPSSFDVPKSNIVFKYLLVSE